MSGSRLNPEAQPFNYKVLPVSDDFRQYFSILLTDWERDDVDIMVSRIETIKTIAIAKLAFEELFKIICELTTNSDTKLKVDNIVTTIDTFDNQLPQIIIDNAEESATEVMKQYYEIRKASFDKCFRKISQSFDIAVQNPEVSANLFEQLKGILLMLAKISKMCYYQDYVNIFMQYLWQIFNQHQTNDNVALCILQTFSLTIDRMLSLLLISIAPEKQKFQIKDEIVLATFVVEILSRLKYSLIHKQFTRDMNIIVLNILDRYDRFIGRHVDAIPENRLTEKGYILCSSLTGTLESDEFYQDFEDFLQDS